MPAPDEDLWSEVKRADLRVTQGDVRETRSSYLSVFGPKERGVLIHGQQQEALIRFRYRGPARTSGDSVVELNDHQIGFKLRARDTCNVFYVMWRIIPEEYLYIAVKKNLQQSQHCQCKNNGYNPVARMPLTSFGISARDHRAYSLRAGVDERPQDFLCTVWIDDQQIWAGQISRELLGEFNGPPGFRTDNGSFIFKLYVRAET